MEEKKTIKFADLLKEKTILILSILFIVGMSIVFVQMFNLAFKVKEKMTKENAALLIKSLEDFRTLYTSEVVVRVKPYGIEVTHDYVDKEGAIPLPATLSMMLGKLIGTGGVTAQARLYSDYPFPWRLKERGPLDQHQREIIAQLRKNPDKPIVRLEETNGNKNLRFAKADIMRASCVKCHNTHPDSPKRDWKVGDVRGVLEVILPMDTPQIEVRNMLMGMSLLIFVVTGLGLFIVSIAIRKLKQEKEVAIDLSQKALAAAHALQISQDELKASSEQLKESTSQIVQSEKLAAIGELTAGVTHELNQPLNVTKIICQSLLHDIEKDRFDKESAKEDLPQIVSQINKMTNIIDHMRLYSRRTEGAVEEKIDVNRVIENTFIILGQQLKNHNIEVIKELSSGLPKIKADEIRLEQVFTNLITNARHALEKSEKEKKRIEIKTYVIEDKKAVVVEVKDNGGGIPEDLQEKIFQAFVTTKEEGKGTGLGLSISKKIIEEHKGRIELESTIGEGAIFRVVLPAVED